MQSDHRVSAGSWFRSQAGRRYGRHFAWLIAAKVVLLALLYFVFVAPQARVDTSPAAVRKRMTPPASPDRATSGAINPGNSP